jgi:hypothetical protein
MSRSTALYVDQPNGFHNVSEAIRWGVAVYDWSNAKALWANGHPMNCDELLTKQAEMVQAADPGVPGEQPRVWVYRNTAKALNFFGSVREKLDDPNYADWFVRFDSYSGPASNASYVSPPCDWHYNSTYTPKCSGHYHDQMDCPHAHGGGPAYPVGGPPSTCKEMCDCGKSPCGEYTFNFRNESLQRWFINGCTLHAESLSPLPTTTTSPFLLRIPPPPSHHHHFPFPSARVVLFTRAARSPHADMISNQTLFHKPYPIGLGWMDDRITLTGMSEQGHRSNFLKDTGLSHSEMTELVAGYKATMQRLNTAVVELGGFTWMLIRGKGPQIRKIPDRHNPGQNITVNASTCTAILRDYCVPEPLAWRQASMYLLQAEWEVLEQGEQVTAEFLLTRGDFAWIGWGWSAPAHTGLPRAEQFDVDYGGKANGPCTESPTAPGLFTREYPKATVSWDCGLGRGTIKMK